MLKNSKFPGGAHKCADILAVVFSLTAIACQGALPRLDSSQFDYKYEMEELPSSQDLDGDGFNDFKIESAPNISLSDGFASIDGRTANAWLVSESGDEGNAWTRYGVNLGTGFTVEARISVRHHVAGSYAFALSASPDSDNHALLNFSTDVVWWGTTVLTNFDMSATFHTFRIAKEAGNASGYYVWCDGKLIGRNLGSAANWGSLNRIIIGAIGHDYRGAAYVSYLRFTKGAYAPPKEKDMRRDSAEFDIKYEMDSLPTSFISSGAVSISPPSDGVVKFGFNQRQFIADSDWTSFSTLARTYGYTIELRAKVDWSTGNGICLTASDNTDYDTFLLVKNGSLSWGPIAAITTITNLDTTADFHVYRIVKEPDNNRFSFYCDGNLVSDSLTDGMSGKDNRFLFGAIGSGYGGTIDVDYLRYTSGVWYPYVPPPGMLLIVE